ncbi:MAG: transcription termination/antitermination protein NusA [Proteobacteria bacterium]|nr:transcription termination/antitermination protein NusA [Pseudomonadota bacterium]
MSQNLNYIIEQVGKDKGIEREVIIDALENAVLMASRKKFGPQRLMEAHYNEEIGEVELFQFVEVVEKVEDPLTQISLDEARQLDPESEIGDSLGVKLDTSDFGRIAAQTAKQVIIQRVRDAERDNIYNEYKDRRGEIVTGSVQRVERGNLYINLGRAEAILQAREQARGEVYRQGDRIRAYILDVQKSSKGPQIFLSRTHPGLLVKLFEMEVPEISEGIIKVVDAAREPGERAKISVYSTNKDVDPVGACVGMRGSRVQSVVQELRGEKIDIIPHSDDIAKYVSNALAPAKISRAYIDEDNRSMEIVVEDDQLSLAIGKRGQNVRLASKLTGFRIDIKSESRMEQISEEIIGQLRGIPHVGEVIARILYNEGFVTVKEIAESGVEELARLSGIGIKKAQKIVMAAREMTEVEAEGTEVDAEEDQQRRSAPISDLKGVGVKTTALLMSKGIKTIWDLAEADLELLSSIPGIGTKKAEILLREALAFDGKGARD